MAQVQAEAEPTIRLHFLMGIAIGAEKNRRPELNRFLWTVLIVCLSPFATQAETLRCVVTSIQAKDTGHFLADNYEFELNLEAHSATVSDKVSLEFNGMKKLVDLDDYSSSRITMTWKLAGAQLYDANSNLNYRATWLRKKNIFIVRVSPFRQRFHGTAEGRGTCSLAE